MSTSAGATMSPAPWRDALVEALGVLLPVSCVGCGVDGRAVCRGCLAELAATPASVRLVAGVRLDAAFEYTGIVRTLVLALKVRNRVDVAGPLGRATGRVVRRALAAAPPDVVVLRVPPSRDGRRRRGFDPVVLLLARGGVRRTRALRRVRPSSNAGRRSVERSRAVEPSGGPGASGRATGGSGSGSGSGSGESIRRRDGGAVAVGAGERTRTGLRTGIRSSTCTGTGTRARHGGQKSRTAVERVAATVGTLHATGVRGRSVVLVDDVVTTGVTMAEAVRAVRAAGGTVVRCVATASVEPGSGRVRGA